MDNETQKSKRVNTNPIIYSVIRKIGTDEVVQIREENMLTKEKKITFQHPEYKKLLEKLKLK